MCVRPRWGFQRMPLSGAGSATDEGGAEPWLETVHLAALMQESQGDPDLAIGLVDGPVATAHDGFTGVRLRAVAGVKGGACGRTGSTACRHGTFIAGILVARRGSGAPAICPDCTLVMRPIFAETEASAGGMPNATQEELASAIVECVNAGVRIVNLSVGLSRTGGEGAHGALQQALQWAADRGVLVVAAAGNQGVLGSTAITRHPWVISVIGCDRQGMPLRESNLANSIGHRGLSAPGAAVRSLRADGGTMWGGGTSVAVPFVTGALALAWSLCSSATAGQIRSTVHRVHAGRRRGVVPAVLNAMELYQALRASTYSQSMRQESEP